MRSPVISETQEAQGQAMLASEEYQRVIDWDLSGQYRKLALAGMQRFFFLGLDLGDFAAEMRSEHEDLVRLLCSDSPNDAAVCMRSQIENSRDRILQALISDRIDIPLE